MRCPSCGHENPEGSLFCESCGSRLAPGCPACGAEISPGARFCRACGQAISEPAAPPTPTPTVPTSFASGRYQVKRFLGEGGWKRVYLAHDTKLDSDVAFALIKTEGLDAEGLTRIRREAKAMGRLRDHPHIVTVFDMGEERGQPYMVQEHMAGGELKELLHQSENHRLPVGQALRIAHEVCQALEYAHGRGVIHRDVKPGNVFLTQDGTARLGDFGLAAVADLSRLTQAGMMMGTVAYMPPEQATGREADARSDLYSLGATLYEMVTGRPPFLGDDAVAVISQHINNAPVAPSWHNSDVPRALEALILRLLAKSPDDRPESAAAVAQELRRVRESSTEERIIDQPVPPAADLQGVAWGIFVGRREEMDQLKAALENTLSGHGLLVTLVGEPGIGKTRLAEELAVYASLRGARVLVGRSYEGEAAVPYGPFIEAFRQYVGSRPDPVLREQLGEGAPEVAKLVSEVRRRFPNIPEAPPLEPDAERLRLFESVTSFVRNAASANPLVLLLDDLHWADKPSLLLLRYLVRGLASERVLFLGVYRDVELDRTHPLAEAVASLRREHPYRRILLRGLSEEDVLALLTAIEPSEESAAQRHALAAALHQETEGNPFFIREVISHLVEEGKLYRERGRWTSRAASISELGIPEGVREAVGRRLSRLSEGCNRMLTLASTMTGGFTWEELKAITGEPEPSLLDLMDEALAAQLIQERGGDKAGVYDFTHALIRQTLYEEPSTPRRVILHRRIGEALEELYAGNLEPHLAKLSYHFFQAAPGGDVDKAIDYATRAAERAVTLLAHEEAALHYGLALQALELRDKPDERLRCDLLLALGDAQNRAGDRDRARDSFQHAASIARTLGDPDYLGRAALGFAGLWGEMGRSEKSVISLLEEAMSALGKHDSALQVNILSRLAWEVWWTEWREWVSGARERARTLSNQAVEMARRLGDPGALASALLIWHETLGRGKVENRLTIANEIVRLAEEAGYAERALLGRHLRIYALMEVGDIAKADAEIEAFAQLAAELRQPQYLGLTTSLRGMRELLAGHFEEAEQLIQQATAMASRAQDPVLAMFAFNQMGYLRWEQERLHEVKDAIEGMVERNPESPNRRTMLASCYCWLGQEDEARREFERLAADDFAEVRSEAEALFFLSIVCAFLGDQVRARTLYELLLPYDGCSWVTVGVCYGPASLFLGTLAATIAQWEQAERHFEAALEMNARMGAPTWATWAQYWYADMLCSRAQPGDWEKALGLLDQALDAAQRMGMKALINRALALKLRAQGIETTSIESSIGAVALSVQSEQPDLRPHAAPDGTVTLLFTDIEGSTAMTERLGDQRWLELLRAHNAIVREQVQAHGGSEVKTIGDGFMVAFGSARRALQCAIDIQRAFAAHSEEHPEEPIRVRIGLHTGEAVKEAEDFYGRHVILASRIADQAQGGEVLVSSLLKELTESAGDIQFGQGREVELKGLSGQHEVFQVAWEQA